MNNDYRLAAKVTARNKVHAAILQIAPEALKAIAPFVGKKVGTLSGMTAKLRAALPELPCTPELHGFYRTSDYAVHLELRVCEQYPDGKCGCCYAESQYCLGNIKKDILQDVNTEPLPEYFRTDYTPEEVYQLRQEEKAAGEAHREAEGKLHHFGKYDQ